MYPIPANATRIRYLESTGTQYVDTGITPSVPSDTVYCKMMSTCNTYLGSGDPHRTSAFFGVLDGYGTNDFGARISWCAGYYGIETDNRVVVSSDVMNALYGKTIEWTLGATERKAIYNGSTITTSNVVTTPYTYSGSSWIFGANGTGTGAHGLLSCRVWSYKLWRNGTLLQDLVPLRVGQVGYLFDRVSGQLFGNAGTGDFVLGPDTFQQGVIPTRMMAMGARKKYKELPDGYTAVDWLDTGFTGTANRGAYFISTNNLSLAENTTKIVANYVCVNNIGEWNVLYTNQTNDNQSGSLIVRKAGSGISGFVGGDNIKSTIVYNQPGIAVVDAGAFYVDNVLIGSKATPATNTLTQKFVIGNVTWQASSKRIWPGLIGRISVYSSGVLVANYVPCQEVATSKYGFYDTVSKNFGSSRNASYPFIPATI